ncbi:MAG: hypothetical protein K5896_11240 [Prevotella sp.]|nr:hypothetical protein [Prevotella sp.]
MNKKAYQKPAIEIDNIQSTPILSGSPDLKDEESDNPSYSRQGNRRSDWDEKEDWD